MKVAYFGKDMFFGCLNLLKCEGADVVALFTEEFAGYDEASKVKAIAKTCGAELFLNKPERADIVQLFEKGCELIVCAGYKYKIPEWGGGTIKYALNVHPSLLPVGRGKMPLPETIIRGHNQTGVTLHKITPEWDAGDILLQETIQLTEQTCLKELLENSREKAVCMLHEFLRNPQKVWNEAKPQNSKNSEYWKMPESGDYSVDFEKGTEDVLRHLRAHYHIHSNGEVEWVSNVNFLPFVHSYAPGTVLTEWDDFLLVAIAGGGVSFQLKRKKID